MWPEDPLHSRTHTPSHVWEKLFLLLSSSASEKPHFISSQQWTEWLLTITYHYIMEKPSTNNAVRVMSPSPVCTVCTVTQRTWCLRSLLTLFFHSLFVYQLLGCHFLEKKLQRAIVVTVGPMFSRFNPCLSLPSIPINGQWKTVSVPK